MNVARFLVPRIETRRFGALLRLSALGLVLGGAYGALHDQVSYAISPEYFTKMKFRQFAWADAGWPPRVFASVVGLVAAGAVGLFVGWFLGRAGLDELPHTVRRRQTAIAFATVLGTTAAAGALGAGLGAWAARGDVSSWSGWRDALDLRDVPSFVAVAYLHAAGYVGAVVGLVAAIVRVRRARRSIPAE
jgi:hypothetical protein